VYLKTLTLKGFKSFASATTMRLEPGITCVVGPNGSGKSNVVDALAWVMGEQGAKSLRGGKMEDVIFAGTAGRPPLGRAEVSLTIDNTDGALPIDYTEVTITRTMFRGGGSEYAINGTNCRLLDVQELLSDSGLGREMHVIVGQGQLDTVLRATPEERRGFIEEAAGVLKHRRRKERALRKLETMEANLTRVQDLTGEIRRQLGPLGRQAEAARRAAVIQADARDARLRLLADDLVQLTSLLEQEVADETALIERRSAVENALEDVRTRLSDVERRSAEAAPELTRAQERFVRLQSLRDRLDSTGSVAAERVRLLSQDQEHEATSGRDPEELRAQAEQARAAEAALLAEVAAATSELAAAVTARQEVEAAYAAEQDRLSRLARAAADRREGLAKLAGQVAARRSRIEAGEAEIGRLEATVAAARARAAEAEQEFAQLEGGVAVEEEGEEGLDEAYESAAARLAEIEEQIEALVARERDAERDRSSATARIEALELSLRRKDGAATLLAAADAEHAVIGTVAALLQVSGGHEAAVAAALGWASEALAVPSGEHAARALESLRETSGGRAALLVGTTASPSDGVQWPALDGSAVWARDVVTAPADVRPAVEQLLERVALVPTAAHALALVARGEGITAVTADGDVFGPGWARGGSSAGGEPARAPGGRRREPGTAGCRDRPVGAGPVCTRRGPGGRECGRDRGRCGARGPARVGRSHGGRRRAAREPGRCGAHGIRRGRTHRAGDRRGAREPRPRPGRARGTLGATRRGAGGPRARDAGTVDRRARPARAGSQPRPHRGDRASADPAHPRGAGPCPQGSGRLPRRGRPQRARRARATARTA
jgi:chromosome segregation protein